MQKRSIRKTKISLQRKTEFDKKIFEYRRFLKDDFDWDYAYILKLLKFKLERTRKQILRNNIVKSAPRIGKQIKTVEQLLERVIRDSYFEEIAEDFHRKYGRPRMTFGKREIGKASVPLIIKYRNETSANAKRIRRESNRLYKRAWLMQQRDLKMAFALMQKNIWGWWD